MHISAKTEYACVAILELAANYGSGKPMRIRDLADPNGIPSRFLVQILLQLKSAGLINSTRGAAGGYQLVRSPEAITLAEVMAAVDGQMSDPHTSATHDRPFSRALMHAWGEVWTAEREMLESVSIADLLERADARNENMYYI